MPDVEYNSAHVDKNNIIAVGLGGGDAIWGWSLENLTRTFSWFSFTGQWIGADGSGGGSSINIGLIANAVGTGAADFDDCPLKLEWTDGTDAGTIKETYFHYGSSVLVRDNVDPGYGDGSTTVLRQGPRYTFELFGTEYRVYIDKIAPGQPPILRLPAPSTGFPFPIKLSGAIIANDFHIRDIVAAGDLLPTTIYSAAEQIEDFGVEQDGLFLRIYQKARYEGIGNPVDV